MERDAIIGIILIVLSVGMLTAILVYSFRLIKKIAEISKTGGRNLKDTLRELKNWKR